MQSCMVLARSRDQDLQIGGMPKPKSHKTDMQENKEFA